jgi:hypothetical protein
MCQFYLQYFCKPFFSISHCKFGYIYIFTTGSTSYFLCDTHLDPCNLRMYEFVWMYVCIYVCMYVLCMYYVCMYACMYVCIMFVCIMFVRIMYVCIMYVCIMYVSVMYVRMYTCMFKTLSLTLLTWRIWWAPNNASRWQMEFILAFKALMPLFL